jgi:hypothetical protein
MTPVSFDALALGAHSGQWSVSQDGKKLSMSVDLYNAVFPQQVVLRENSVQETPLTRQVVSAVCGGVSVLCLLLTLVTYSLFSSLCALPGLNNMGLCATLGLAQLSLLMPWHRTGSATVCQLVGMLTHWLWLQALGWMAVCCVHMARVFAASTRHSTTRKKIRRKFVIFILITSLGSAAVVGITIGVALGVSGGSNVGYGGPLCFLDTAAFPLLVLAFVVPLGLVVLTNLVCFVFTVVSIARVRRLQPTRGEAQQQQQNGGWRDVVVYAKLVTVTGGAWALGLTTEAADSEGMRVVAELLTALQGLLIFLAYVCNQRVWNLYKTRLGRGDTAVPVTATTSISGNKRSND